MDLLTACKLAYRKHHLNDDSIGWDELGECLLDALCNEMGDDGFQEWLGYCKESMKRDPFTGEMAEDIGMHKKGAGFSVSNTVHG